MAFHPFQFFRKRQKTFLAILTIMTMFIFILTGFSGSIVDKAQYWFGGGSRRFPDKTEVTQLYGKKVTVGELDQLSQDRRMADAFIKGAISMAGPTLTSDESKEVQAKIQQMVLQEQMRLFNMKGETPPPSMLRFSLDSYRRELLKENKANMARYVGHRLRIMDLLDWQQAHPGQVYFGGGIAPDDLLDFLIWRRQADRLNITLRDEDLRREINKEANPDGGSDVLTGDQEKDNEKLKSYVQGVNRGADPKDVFAALRDEFRVRLAKEVLLGSAGGARGVSDRLVGEAVLAGGTPGEFWDFFRDNRTELNVDFLKVPVSQFTSQVKDPTEREAADLYRKHKNDEPNPDSQTPGFKVPRRVKVEWVAADPTAPAYRDAAAKIVDDFSKMSADAALVKGAWLLPANAASPAGVAGTLAPLALPSLWNPPLQFTYESYVREVKSWWDASGTGLDSTSPYTVGLNRPDTVASVVGHSLGVADRTWGALSVAAAVKGTTEARLAELKARQASMVLAGANPFPFGVAAQEAALSSVPVPKLSAVREEMAVRVRDRIAPELAKAAMDSFLKELEAKRSNPKEAAEYVARHANIEHGITGHGVMAEARGETEIAEAKELAPLKKAAERDGPMTPEAARAFARRFFAGGKLYQPTPFRPKPSQMDQFQAPGEAPYQVWLTEDDKPYVPPFAEARPKVDAAWKLIQARKVAREAAERIIDNVKKKRGQGYSPDRSLNDEAEGLKAAHPGAGFETFPVIDITRLVKHPSPQVVGPAVYEPYRFKESQIAYARADTADELFKALKEPGDATVIADRPERNYYVAVLTERKPPSEDDFYRVYKSAPARFAGDSLLARFQQEREQKYRTELMRHFRDEAKAPLDDQGNYKIDPDVRKHFRGGAAEE
jgi:hypothetical protein